MYFKVLLSVEDGESCEKKLGTLKYFKCFLLIQSLRIKRKCCPMLYMKLVAHYGIAHWTLTVDSKHKAI